MKARCTDSTCLARRGCSHAKPFDQGPKPSPVEDVPMAGILRRAAGRTPKISGYRTLTGAEIAIINRINAKAEEVRQMLEEVQGHDVTYNVDPRWLAIGRTGLQQGFMAVIRAVARPETF